MLGIYIQKWKNGNVYSRKVENKVKKGSKLKNQIVNKVKLILGKMNCIY